jgi:hypothetical protein
MWSARYHLAEETSRFILSTGADGEPTPVGVRQLYPSRPELSAQEPVFDDQVGENFTFAPLKPTGEHQEQPLESGGPTTSGRLYRGCNTPIESWDVRAR